MIDSYTARSRVIEVEQTYVDLTARIGSPTIVAPVDGIVTQVNVVAGLGAPSGDAIVIDASGFRLTADVVESDVSSVGVGQAATVNVDAIDADSLTLLTESGAAIELTLGADTRYHRQADASADDVQTGTEVIVQLDAGVRSGSGGDPAASQAPAGPIGTAADVTVVPDAP